MRRTDEKRTGNDPTMSNTADQKTSNTNRAGIRKLPVI